MPDLHELLATEARRGGPVAAPPFDTLVARARKRRVKQALAITGVVVVVTAAIAVPLTVGGHGPTEATGPAVTATDAARKTAAQEVVNQMVADVNLPVGASPLASAPAFPTFQGPTDSSVTAERYFTVAEAVESVISYVTAHPPAGLIMNGTTTETNGTGSGATVESRGVDFVGAATSSYGSPELSVDVVPQGGGAAVIVSAQAELRPLRTAAERVPANVAAVTVTVRQSGGALQTYKWDSSRARVLASALNAFDALLPGSGGPDCPASNPDVTVTFEVSHQPLVFADDGCGFTEVTVGGVAQPALEGTVDSRVYGMLGVVPPPQSSAPPAGAASAPGVSSPAP
jgi:hypothetical protein